ncbi:MAG: DUF3110 domain-containing protein [Prochlorothrix sp.]|nr:DUF3110 domain-containing protein [Prochlorothrix sp.]
MEVFVLLYQIGPDQEGIHTLRMGDRSVVLMFEEEDDATRYAILLEAQDFMVPSVERLDREEVESYCEDAGYESRLVPAGFIPQNEADRLLLAPPENNIETDLDSLKEDDREGNRGRDRDRLPSEPSPEPDPTAAEEYSQPELDDIRRRLEGLL